ncbi:hypothetical protein BOTBODRAFT_554729 [Botryobasidium botryosum FD-172 SS1]|uniref:Glycoside hydrolase family 16 protein n=1 Tax=Botryobasidium botryosum (strain FD-172 SS1) TaxID=930990 RepID=A0A067N3C1_BOTB1|nr:hypothetical protein BOTBODRAFT_554729 [Botryobasidium botryosum FD-172 SS1]
MKVTRWVLSILLPLCPSASALFLVPSVPLSISRLYNNIASGPNADFDPHYGGSFPSQYLPTGQFYHDGVHFVLPESWEGSKDNILADGQVLDARDAGFTREFHMLYAGDWIDGESGARFTFSFEDGTQDEIEVSIKNWWTLHWLNDGVIKA